MFEYFEKRFYYSDGGHFQHANTDYIMTMNFIRINFTDDFSNIILREFNVCQVLIVNGISWWGEKNVIFNNWAVLQKKELKRTVYLLKPVTICNFLSWKIGKVQGTFSSFNISRPMIFWSYGIIFWHVLIVFAFAAFHIQVFIYQALQCFKFGCSHITFIFQIQLIKFIFFLNFCFHFIIYPRMLPLVRDFGFMGNKIYHDIKNSFIKNQDLLLNTLDKRSSFPYGL